MATMRRQLHFESIFIIASAEEEFSIRQESTAVMRQFGRRICDNDEEVKRIKEDVRQIVARNPETFKEEHNESISPPLSRPEKPLLEPGSSATHLALKRKHITEVFRYIAGSFY
jgi:hypothetical protein